MKLITLDDMDYDNRLTCWLRDWIAATPDLTGYLYRSAGRRIYGRPYKYILHTPNMVKRFSAYTDIEAFNKANKFLMDDTPSP